MFTFKPALGSSHMLDQYSRLFQACFPGVNHLDPTYLHWLYVMNPSGSVIGMDAFHGDRLAAHYACIPVEIEFKGQPVRAMLSLNTATHPDFQGKGLFTQLAERTYELGHSQGMFAVYGVANANSTPGFLRKLGFQLVRPLDARVGLGAPVQVEWSRVSASAQFRRIWSPSQVQWRARNPANPLTISTDVVGIATITAKTDHKGFRAWSRMPVHESLMIGVTHRVPALNLFLGLLPDNTYHRGICIRVPNRFRPSPLNLIFRHLEGGEMLDPRNVCFSFVDFDAY